MLNRVYHIAFEKKLDIKLLMEVARKTGLAIKTHMGPIEPDVEERLRSAVDRISLVQTQVAAPAPPKAPEPAPAPAPAPAPVATAQAVTRRIRSEIPSPDAIGVVIPAAEPVKPERAPVVRAPDAASVKAPPKVIDAALAEKLGEADKAKAKPGVKKKKKLRDDSKPLDSAEIIEELKGRFLGAAMKEVLGAGRRVTRPRPVRVRRTVRGGSRKPERSPQSLPGFDKEIEIALPVTLKDLSSQLGIKANLLMQKLIETGAMLKVNDMLGADLIELLAVEFGRQIKIVKQKDIEEVAEEATRVMVREENLITRAPVVTFMGHVDHGKTSLLDAIRSTNVTAGEAGGITQHMAAYSVTQDDKTVVFLDTPGHEAFTDMRARGAQVTDIIVLVVAADDGIMPQTDEAINHAKAAGVPIIVALNKIDKPDANPDMALQQLAHRGLTWDKWGGDTVVVKTSAIRKEGIEELIEMIHMVAELLDLKADPLIPARGTIIEAQLHEGRGVVATALVTEGTLKIGDNILVGHTFGKVRALYSDSGKLMRTAGPSTPVVISGLNHLPGPGDQLVVMDSETAARDIAEVREQRDKVTGQREHVSLDNLFAKLERGKINEVRFILKADGQGSITALHEKLESLSTGEVRVRILHTGVGGVNESDVILAHASDAIIIGFHIIASERARSLAQEKGVDIRLFNIIYQILDDVSKALEGTLEPDKVEEVKGHAEVRQVFKISKVGTIAGCYVRHGVIERGNSVRLIRNSIVIWDKGRMESLRRIKDDVKEVKEGFECGIKLAGYDDLKDGDIIEAFMVNLVPRKLNTVK